MSSLQASILDEALIDTVGQSQTWLTRQNVLGGAASPGPINGRSPTLHTCPGCMTALLLTPNMFYNVL